MVFWELSFFIRSDNKLAFLEKKSFETCFVYFATLPKQLTTIKCFQKKQKTGFEIFSKTANFLSFSERNQTIIVTSFYPKSPWNGPFADSLGKLWSEGKDFKTTKVLSEILANNVLVTQKTKLWIYESCFQEFKVGTAKCLS